jgi:putative membrane protein
MGIIIEILVEAGVLIGMAAVLPTVIVRNYATALLVALVVAILNATIGALIRFPMNLVTLYFLSFLVRLVVTALMIKIADKMFTGFDVKGFTPALLIAVVMAIVGSLFSF